MFHTSACAPDRGLSCCSCPLMEMWLVADGGRWYTVESEHRADNRLGSGKSTRRRTGQPGHAAFTCRLSADAPRLLGWTHARHLVFVRGAQVLSLIYVMQCKQELRTFSLQRLPEPPTPSGDIVSTFLAHCVSSLEHQETTFLE